MLGVLHGCKNIKSTKKSRTLRLANSSKCTLQRHSQQRGMLVASSSFGGVEWAKRLLN